MSKFKVGDKVKFTRNNPYNLGGTAGTLRLGDVGVVRNIGIWVNCEFPNFTGHASLFESELELVDHTDLVQEYKETTARLAALNKEVVELQARIPQLERAVLAHLRGTP